tara:strand:+ start:3729 stop:4322 length:594 start_codon:yes stop_codon:yes gene_type:complete
MLELPLLTGIMLIIAYLLGSISSAMTLCHILQLPDPRTQGSHNPGATNILRLHGALYASIVLVFDALKGGIPVYISYRLGISPFWLGLIAVSACIGHIFPLFFKFKGGKGVATALGTIAPIDHWLVLCVIVTWLSALALFRYASIAAIITACVTPFYTHWFDARFTLPVSMLCFLIVLCHHNNMKQLIQSQREKRSP